MRYWFVKLEIQSGEYSVTTSSAHSTRGTEEFDAEDYAKNYWNEGEDTYNDGTYYFDCGCVACKVYDCFEITKQEHKVLVKYL